MNTTRDMLFLSHANPEDNEFTQWLALQLAREGFPVWCDLTKLLGGEDFWRNIESAIRERTVKFIYVLSRASNTKTGPRKELAVAQVVAKHAKNFIIPVKVDDLPHDDTNIELKCLNALDFSKSWADGLAALLRCLNEDPVPRKQSFTPDAVAGWWRQHYGENVGVSAYPDVYRSNWYQVETVPPVHLHLIQGDIEKAKKDIDATYPVFPLGKAFLSFASADVLGPSLRGVGLSVARTSTYDAQPLVYGEIDSVPEKEGRNAVLFLLRASWETEMLHRGLSCYGLAHQARCFWFRRGQIPKDTVPFVGVDGKRTDRQLVGRMKGLTWHFAVQARSMLSPSPAFAIKTHVVFTNDGLTPIESASQQHSARRSIGKNWWNPEWRDRLTAMMTHLSATTPGFVEVATGGRTPMRMCSEPCLFESPASYSVVEDQPPECLPDDEGIDEEEVPNEPVDSDP